jgi:nitric oxide reductase NorE protein
MSKSITLKEPYPPGDLAIWIIIYVEFITFALLFLGYAFSRRLDVELFNASQLAVNQTSGFINTFILITSSYFVVKAVKSIRNMTQESQKESNMKASKWLLFAIMCGIAFLMIKVTEFSYIFGVGIHMSTNTYFMFYIMLTVFHFLHVLLGTGILFIIYKKTKIYGYLPNDSKGIETGASYWHMVDLLWIVLFPLVYIIR